MPSLITEVATWAASLFVPNDGEGATKASLLTNFFQPVANRLAYLKGVVDVTGPQRFARCSDFTALHAVTGMVTGDMRFVDTIGLYRYDSTVAVAESIPWFVTPTSVGGGSGRWVHSAVGLLISNHGNGVATIDTGTGKIWEPVPNRIVNVYDLGNDDTGVLDSTTSASFTAGIDLGINILGVRTNDFLVIRAHFSIYSSAASDSYARLAVIEDVAGTPTTTPFVRAVAHNNTNSAITGQRSLGCMHVATAAAGSGTTANIRLQLKSNGSDTAALRGPYSVTVLHLRP